MDNHGSSKIFLTNPVKLNTFQTNIHSTRDNLNLINKCLGLKAKNYLSDNIITNSGDKKEIDNFIKKK
jgi:hypothetical protein